MKANETLEAKIDKLAVVDGNKVDKKVPVIAP